MSMYNLVFGTSGWPRGVMALVIPNPDMIGRYRDHWMEAVDNDDALVLAIYTRMGGGNREDYAETLAALHALPEFLSDDDDTYDSTYCTLRFKVTKAKAQEMIEGAGALVGDSTFEQAWQEMCNHAEWVPRDMSLVWEAMIATLGGEKEGEQ